MQELAIGETKVAVAQESPWGFLGRLLWYSVRKQRIRHEDPERLLEQEGVPRDAWPARTRPVDAFKAAVREVQSRDYFVDYDTVYQPDGSKKTDRRRMLVVSRVHDQVADALPVTMKASFDEAHGHISFDGGTPDLQARVEQAYDENVTSYRDEDIRKMVTDAIHRAFATSVKQSGGVYFVPEVYTSTVEAVARVVDQLPGCEMVAVPVIDREPERKTLIRQYEKATVERIGEIMVQVKETLDKGDEIVPSVFSRFHEELTYLREQKAKYEGFLSVAMDKVAVEMQALDAYMGRLAGLIKPA